MKWTKELPTEPGFYWAWNKFKDNLTVYEVTKDDGELWYQCVGDRHFYYDYEAGGQYWAGPIFPPKKYET